MSIREKILQEYRSENFDPKSKASYDGEKCFYTCAEKIRFFNADYPNGTIKTEVVIDNNIFATVKATVICEDCTREAYGKWYHTNADVFGMNYLGTAQTVAISKALTLMGYSADKEENAEPDGAFNIAPEDSAPSDDIPTSPPIDITVKGLSVDQAMASVLYGSPFAGRTIKQIISDGNPTDITALANKLRAEMDMGTSLAPAAEVILPIINVDKGGTK